MFALRVQTDGPSLSPLGGAGAPFRFLRGSTVMNPSTNLRPTLAVFAMALGLLNTAFAQSAPDTSSANAPDATATTTTTTTTTAAAPGLADSDAPTQAAGTSAAAQGPESSAEAAPSPAGAIGSTGIDRADSANAAFSKLDAADRGFVSRADTAQLPGFGDAFAQADHDGDGRLDRTEFIDAWSAYVARALSAETTVTTTTTTSNR